MARKLLYAKKLFADTLTLLADPEIRFITIKYDGTVWEGRTNHILHNCEGEIAQLTWCGIRRKDVKDYTGRKPNSRVCSSCVREIMTPPLELVHKNFGKPHRKERRSG